MGFISLLENFKSLFWLMIVEKEFDRAKNTFYIIFSLLYKVSNVKLLGFLQGPFIYEFIHKCSQKCIYA